MSVLSGGVVAELVDSWYRVKKLRFCGGGPIRSGGEEFMEDLEWIWSIGIGVYDDQIWTLGGKLIVEDLGEFLGGCGGDGGESCVRESVGYQVAINGIAIDE